MCCLNSRFYKGNSFNGTNYVFKIELVYRVIEFTSFMRTCICLKNVYAMVK